MTATPPPLPAFLTARGGDPDMLGKELLGIIADAIAHQPRTLQQRIGPSEIGHPCARRLGYKLLRTPDLNLNQGVSWKSFVGTAMHSQLADVFEASNQYYRTWVSDTDDRWLIEQKITCGWVGPDEIDGNSDLYDRVTATVVDWKLVGPTPLKNYRSKGPGKQYRTQGHTYGRGFAHAGLPVDTVMIVFLPRNGELLEDTYVWHEPYDEQISIDGFNRVEAIKTVVDTLGRDALALLPTADAYCYRCPYFKRGSVEIKDGCPGHPSDTPPPKPALSLEGKP